MNSHVEDAQKLILDSSYESLNMINEIKPLIKVEKAKRETTDDEEEDEIKIQVLVQAQLLWNIVRV